MAVITISRQYGSGGEAVALWVCKLLGYHYFDKLMMLRVAAELGLSVDEIVDLSEDNYKVQSFLDRLVHFTRTVVQVKSWQKDAFGVMTEEVEKLDAAKALGLVERVIEAAYQQRDTVIVGRGGQVILKDKPGVLHVRLEAPLAERSQRIHENSTYSLAGAKDLAIKRDRAAADYLRRFYEVDWADPELYDLVINTGKFGIDGATQLVASGIKQLTPSLSPSQELPLVTP